MKIAGYKDDVIYNMDDVSVFRRFFVASALLSEILGGLMNGMGNAMMGGGEQAPVSTAAQTATYGANPYVDTTYNSPSSSESNSNQDSTNNNMYNFPSG